MLVALAELLEIHHVPTESARELVRRAQQLSATTSKSVFLAPDHIRAAEKLARKFYELRSSLSAEPYYCPWEAPKAVQWSQAPEKERALLLSVFAQLLRDQYVF